MDVTDHWRHYYLDSAGNVKKRKKDLLPKYLRRAKSFTANSTIISANNNSNIFRGWNRSAYFRFKANQNNSTSKSQSAPDSGYSGSTTKSVKSILAPLFSDKSNNKSVKNSANKILSRKSKPPTDLLMNNNHHSITGKVVIVTPRLIVTKTSPTPTEENSPILSAKENNNSSNLNSENDKQQVTELVISFFGGLF